MDKLNKVFLHPKNKHTLQRLMVFLLVLFVSLNLHVTIALSLDDKDSLYIILLAGGTKDAEDLHNIGLSHAYSGEHELAIAVYNLAIALDGDFSAAYFSKGLSLIESGLYEQAVMTYDHLIELNTYPSPNAWHNKGVALEKLGLDEQAKKAFEKSKLLKKEIKKEKKRERAKRLEQMKPNIVYAVISLLVVFFFFYKDSLGPLVASVLVCLWNVGAIILLFFGTTFSEAAGGIAGFFIVAGIASAILLSPKPSRRGGSIEVFEGWWVVVGILFLLAILFGGLAAITE